MLVESFPYYTHSWDAETYEIKVKFIEWEQNTEILFVIHFICIHILVYIRVD